MIKFFSKIKRKLIDEGNLKRYLIYAAGEIILVVIGILIALQINNLNTQKVENAALHGYLNNIQKNIKGDIIQAQEIKIFRDSAAAFSKKIIKIAKQDSISKNQFYSSWYYGNYHVFYLEYIQANKSGFEALKNSGYLSKIQGTEIESKLYEYYFILSKIEEFEEDSNEFLKYMVRLAFQDKVPQKLDDLRYGDIPVSSDFSKESPLVLESYNHPGLSGANYGNVDFAKYMPPYDDLILKGEEVIKLIEALK